MKAFFYDLAGGINFASTKTDLGLDVKKIYWSDSKNVEILQNKGIVKQKGNSLFFTLPSEEIINSLFEMKKSRRIIISTVAGNLYVYNPANNANDILSRTISGKPNFINFLDGILVASPNDAMFFVKKDLTIEDCNLTDGNNEDVKSDIVAVHKGRVWVADGSKIYFSALGTYNDFATENDAGYIADFYTDTDDITALKPYKEYLAIYKRNMVYLLTGTSPDDFAVVPFADKGCFSANGVINVLNKQYFLNNGIFALEQVGDLNQIQLGDEITLKIKSEFDKFEANRMKDVIAIHYEKRNQVWYFMPYLGDSYFHTIWINDYINKSWYKRVLPQNITCATVFGDNILTADNQGNIYLEDFSSTFNGTAIDFMWKSPFLILGEPNCRKCVDEFYFVLDESFDNNFNFSVYKNYDSEFQDDLELVLSSNSDNMIWADDFESNRNVYWNDDDDNLSNWAFLTEGTKKTEISGANYAIQLCVEGNLPEQGLAIIGLEFKQIFLD